MVNTMMLIANHNVGNVPTPKRPSLKRKPGIYRSTSDSTSSTVSSTATNKLRVSFKAEVIVRVSSSKPRSWKETKESWWTEYELSKIQQECVKELLTVQRQNYERPGKKSTSLFGNKQNKKKADDNNESNLTARGLEAIFPDDNDPRLQQRKGAVKCLLKSYRRRSSSSNSSSNNHESFTSLDSWSDDDNENGDVDDKYMKYYKQCSFECSKRAVRLGKLDAAAVRDYLKQ